MITGYAKAKKVNKADYQRRVEALRVDLINAQYDLKSADFPLIIVIAGDDRVGAAEVVNRLNQWMDSRDLATHVLGEPSEEEAQHPRFWRLWQSIPPKGQAALWVGGLMRMVAAYLTNEVTKSELNTWSTNLRQFQEERHRLAVRRPGLADRRLHERRTACDGEGLAADHNARRPLAHH